jgi:hypothetical protein
MGQNNSRQSETINWNQLKTNEMSSTIPNIDGISIEAKELISKLNLPEISDSNSEFNINNVFKTIDSQNINNVKQPATEFDATSPFISSEMYNYLVNKYNTNSVDVNMTGGVNVNNTNGFNINMTGGGKLEEDSETSATSSSLDSSELKSSPSETDDESVKKNKKNKKHITKDSSKDKKSSESVQIESDNYEGWNNKNFKSKTTSKATKKSSSKATKAKKSKTTKSKNFKYTGTEDYLSYVSSSAHTGGSMTESVANENTYTISTVNTSDINMISE